MENMALHIFQALHGATETPEGKVIYILTIICVLMIIDFITGSIAAWRNPDIKFRSQEGINGILRKLCSIIVLVACIPIAPLVPADAGVAALIVLYVGYLIMEFKSILENLGKMGVEITPLTEFLNKVGKCNNNEGKDDKHD